ncbi:MAG TPA: hypothetical protein VJ831_15970 [Jatrophihabitantaceae bacterium]|nr:hypothetical protein [Jatrophihabitantaceae bacterium]
MTIHLDDQELDALLRASDPVDLDAVHRAVASTGAQALRHSISDATVRSRRRRLRRPAVLVAAAIVAAAVPLALTFVSPSSNGRAYGAELVKFAENSPRLLVGADGWRVTRADEQDSHTGEMTFTSGSSQMDVFWVAGATSKETDKYDLKHVIDATIDGSKAWVGVYDNSHEFEALWSVGDQAREARGVFTSPEDFLAVATTLHRVDVDTWLNAMPASVVSPENRAAVIGQMLSDVPKPPDFDVAKLLQGPGVSDRYQLGAHVIAAVSCAWIHQWAHGTPAERAEAAAAMAGSHNWAILNEMNSDGDYPEVVWEIADALNGKPLTITKGVSLEDWSKPALGC